MLEGIDQDFNYEPYKSDLIDDETEEESSTDSPSLQSKTLPSSSKTTSSTLDEVILVDEIILNVHFKYAHNELKLFADELTRPNPLMSIGDRQLSTLELYALKSTREPIDISNQSVRKVYLPTLFIRKNDAFGPWNFNYLLNLMEINYECPKDEGFPKLWKTTDQTKVMIKIFHCKDENSLTPAETNATSNVESEEESTSLLGVLRKICRQNKYDNKDADAWLRTLKEESIKTFEHLQVVTSNDSWEHISSIKYLPKQMIRDYMQLNMASDTFNKVTNPYKESTASLLGDIHRLRRYFYYVTDNLEHLSYLDRRAVDLAIEDVRRSYDDDGNILSNIHNYLTTFCLKNVVQSKADHENQKKAWQAAVEKLRSDIKDYQRESEKSFREYEAIEKDVRLFSVRLENLTRRRREVYEKADQFVEALYTENISNRTVNSIDRTGEARRKKVEYENEVKNIQVQYELKQQSAKKKKDEYLGFALKAANAEKKIQNLNENLKLNVAEEHRKLNVKFGRGLLLYGPPGTGKSELLKRVAVYAGITMTTSPLAAGELNRPYVGQTEKLLIDIMYRAKTIPYLICAMTIDEIDGLVPKRDNNAQQSKVDGISVLLSHIEGVKNIPNLIVFGATNRRNMMDEAFLRRMQAKCFVGRPSPAIREKMLRALLVKNSHVFNNERIDFLVKVTTNFSGAAVAALRSNIVVAMENQPQLSNNALLEIADNVAREFSCWFGVATLPEIFRLHPSILNTEKQDEYSLSLPKTPPTGRILVDLQERKCFIELMHEPTVEKDLSDEETSMLTLLSRFVHGCSSRNIDTIQIIDLNFLTKNNAFDENQRYEILTTTFQECNEYNRSMLIFDIDSLIMLSIQDSDMSKSSSISNITLYQSIREICKAAIVEQKPKSTHNDQNNNKEKWIVMIVKRPLLRNRLIEDIEFKKTNQQIEEEKAAEEEKLDSETEKKCPKCLTNYIPSKANYGSCHYHDGFVYNLDNDKHLTNDEAQHIMLEARIANRNAEQQPKLIWACCLGVYGHDKGCQLGICGLPKELKDRSDIDLSKEDPVALVEKHFMKNRRAEQKVKSFVDHRRKTSRDVTLNKFKSP